MSQSMSLTDRLLLQCVKQCITGLRALSKAGRTEQWEPGKPLKLFLVSYSGTRNTGADIRVEETVRQLVHLLGRESLCLQAMTVNPSWTKGYYTGAEQKHCSYFFLKWLMPMVRQSHGVIACEGSMFKSQFTNILPIYLIGDIALAEAEQKLAVSYGVEAGPMPDVLWQFARQSASRSLVLARNAESLKLLDENGLRTGLGTDTAWTFSTALEYGKQELKKVGWDGKKPILALAIINPFCWPVTASISKWIGNALAGLDEENHYASLYFFTQSKEREEKFKAYLHAIAKALKAFSSKHDIFPILIGMERLDRKAIGHFQQIYPDLPAFVSDQYDMFEMVSILRQTSFIISSRYHAVVTSMASQIPSGAISMDLRLQNLMKDRNHSHLLASVDSPDLDKEVSRILEALWLDRDVIKEDIGRFAVQQYKLFGEMGIAFCRELLRVYPKYPIPKFPENWFDALPPLTNEQMRLVEKYG